MFICLIQELGFCISHSSFISYLDFQVDSTKKSLNRRQEDTKKDRGEISFLVYLLFQLAFEGVPAGVTEKRNEPQRGEKEKSIHLDQGSKVS